MHQQVYDVKKMIVFLHKLKANWKQVLMSKEKK
jgi:hypothetical protein